jgi:peptidoglycan hydrolase-like protein with peptidoglycan-binding domain
VHEQHRHTGAPTYLGKLKFGQRDSDSVRNLQRALNVHKMAGGHNLPVTGYYGPQTDQEVRLCQKLHDLGHDPARGSNVGPKQAKHLGLPDVRR